MWVLTIIFAALWLWQRSRTIKLRRESQKRIAQLVGALEVADEKAIHWYNRYKSRFLNGTDE